MGEKREVQKPSVKAPSVMSSSAANIVYIWKMYSTFLSCISTHSLSGLFLHAVSRINVFMILSLNFYPHPG